MKIKEKIYYIKYFQIYTKKQVKIWKEAKYFLFFNSKASFDRVHVLLIVKHWDRYNND